MTRSGACADLNPVYRRLLHMALDELRVIEEQIAQLDEVLAGLLRTHQDVLQRLAVPDPGVDSVMRQA